MELCGWKNGGVGRAHAVKGDGVSLGVLGICDVECVGENPGVVKGSLKGADVLGISLHGHGWRCCRGGFPGRVAPDAHGRRDFGDENGVHSGGLWQARGGSAGHVWVPHRDLVAEVEEAASAGDERCLGDVLHPLVAGKFGAHEDRELLNGDGGVVREGMEWGGDGRVEGDEVPGVWVTAMGFEVSDHARGVDCGATGAWKGPLGLGKDVV
jgi:hypothetical protein